MADQDDEAARKVCHVCNGGKTVGCTVCGGVGQIPDPANPNSYSPCPNGTRGEMTCPHCGGSGWD